MVPTFAMWVALVLAGLCFAVAFGSPLLVPGAYRIPWPTAYLAWWALVLAGTALVVLAIYI